MRKLMINRDDIVKIGILSKKLLDFIPNYFKSSHELQKKVNELSLSLRGTDPYYRAKEACIKGINKDLSEIANWMGTAHLEASLSILNRSLNLVGIKPKGDIELDPQISGLLARNIDDITKSNFNILTLFYNIAKSDSSFSLLRQWYSETDGRDWQDKSDFAVSYYAFMATLEGYRKIAKELIDSFHYFY